MKAVLMSIQPRFCELIASGKKAVEVRKTKPKLETPFKVYIYCTKGKPTFTQSAFCDEVSNGKVVGEFVCEGITDIRYYVEPDDNGFGDYSVGMPHPFCDWFAESTCLGYEELHKYLQGNHGYGWHIFDLIIYDKPRELGEFYTLKKCHSCDSGYESSACIYDEDCRVPSPITRPPQSWMYCEEVKRDG